MRKVKMRRVVTMGIQDDEGSRCWRVEMRGSQDDDEGLFTVRSLEGSRRWVAQCDGVKGIQTVLFLSGGSLVHGAVSSALCSTHSTSVSACVQPNKASMQRVAPFRAALEGISDHVIILT